MTIVSSKEFAINQNQYFDLAMTEQVLVQRDNIMFMVTMANEIEKKYLEPDDDLRRAITAEELKKRMHESIRNFFADKQLG
jgi:hypothetical protein